MCKSINELSKFVADYRELKAIKAEIEEQLKATEQEIFSYFDLHDKQTETGSDFTIKVASCQRKTLDSKRLEADLGCLVEYEKVTTYRRLYVK